jgi:iron complex outermembrane receptor protein
MSYYDTKYKDFKTRLLGADQTYDHKTVVGVPRNKYAIGLDLYTKPGFYLVNTIIIWEMYTQILPIPIS